MKQCTVCRTTYTDDSLRYCLADGGSLVDVPGETETVVRPGVRVDNNGPASNPRIPETPPSKNGGISTVVKVVIALLLVGFLGLLALGGAGALFYFNTGPAVVTVSPTPTPARTPSSTPSPEASVSPDDNMDDLDKQIADLQKKLEEMVNAAPGKKTADDGDGTAKAIVNSPKDGFLALREAPDADSGQRIAKIPHGSVVTLENCEKEKVTIGGRSGRWCMVTYNDETGWVFDAWLVY